MKSRSGIIIYGLRYSDYAMQRKLFALRNNRDIDIVAEIAYDPTEEEIFFKRSSFADAFTKEYDSVIVCSGTVEEARRNLSVAGFDDIRLDDISTLTRPHYEVMKQRQLDVLSELIEAPDEKIRNREWLRKKLFAYGFFPFFKLAKEPQKDVKWSTKGILQVPDEFVDFCIFLLNHKMENAIEIGVAAGASSYVMAAIMSRNNPDFIYHMVDINDQLSDFETVKKIIPSLHKDIPKTSDDFAGMEFDFCFIDADHSYDGMMRDWNNVGRFAKKLTVFHDIFGHEYDGLNGGTVRGWQEIKKSVKSESIHEFSRFPDRWMGIGVIDKNESVHR